LGLMKGRIVVNITHLKYALEVEKTGSITKAAENLFMGQPNLSRVIKELEDATGIKIFSRTSKGIIPTENGRIFLDRAAEIVRQTQELEHLFKSESGGRQTFRAAGQSSSSLLNAYNRTVSILAEESNYDCHLVECQSSEALELVARGECTIGVMRAGSADIETLQSDLWEKNVRCRPVGSFRYVVILPKDHPLAAESEITPAMLEPYTLVTSSEKRELGSVSRMIYYQSVVACYASLADISGGYMISRPMPKSSMERYGLVVKPYNNGWGEMTDLLIYHADHKFYDADAIFAEEFRKSYWDLNGDNIVKE